MRLFISLLLPLSLSIHQSTAMETCNPFFGYTEILQKKSHTAGCRISFFAAAYYVTCWKCLAIEANRGLPSSQRLPIELLPTFGAGSKEAIKRVIASPPCCRLVVLSSRPQTPADLAKRFGESVSFVFWLAAARPWDFSPTTRTNKSKSLLT